MQDQIIQIVANQAGVDATKVKTDSALVSELGLDSLDILEVVMAVEDEFDIMIDDLVAEKLATVQDIIDAVSAEVAKAGA